MERCFVRSLWTAFCVGTFVATFSSVFVPKANAQWEFNGAYTEDGYTADPIAVSGVSSRWMYDDNQPGLGGNSSATSGANLLWAHSASSVEAGRETLLRAYSNAGYRYYPAFAWTGSGSGNPNNSINTLSVFAYGLGEAGETAYGTYGGAAAGEFMYGISTPNNYWRKGVAFPASGLSLNSLAVSANQSFSSDWVATSVEATAYSDCGPRGDPGAFAYAEATVTLGYTATSN